MYIVLGHTWPSSSEFRVSYMSKKWSCGTLEEGYNGVMDETLDREERQLKEQIEDPLVSKSR